MKTRYELQPVISTAPVEGFAFGRQSAPIPDLDVKETKPEKGFLPAMIERSIPAKVGATVTQNLLLDDKKQEGYDPFEKWKDSGLSDDYLEDFMNTKNESQLLNMMARIHKERENAEAVKKYGLVGEAADFVFNLGTDPTFYATFGLGSLLKIGMKASAAYGVSGLAGGAAYATLQEVGSPEQNNANTFLTTTVASGIVGAGLGKGIDTYKALKAKKIISDEDFGKKSVKLLNDALDQTNNFPQNVGAMASNKNFVQQGYDSSLGGNMVARSVAKLVDFGVPKLYGQNAKLKETRDVMLSVFGQGGYSKLNLEGVATPVTSVGAEVSTIRQQIIQSIGKDLNSKKIVKTYGKMYDDVDLSMATLAQYDDSLVETLTPLQKHIYDWSKKTYTKYADELESAGTEGFIRRSAYHGPALFDKNKVRAKFDDAVQTIFKDLTERQSAAAVRIAQLTDEINVLQGSKGAEGKITKLSDEIENLQKLTRATSDELLEEANFSAQRMATGDYGKAVLDPELTSKSRYFNPRYMDVKKYVDFLELDPAILAVTYTNNIAPHLAFAKKLGGYKNFQELLDDYETKAMDSILKSGGKNTEKLMKEKDTTKDLLKRFWDVQTGTEAAQKYSQLGRFAPLVSAVHSLSYITQMVGQTLAALHEPVAIALHHGLSGSYGMAKTMAYFASSKEVRALSKEMMEHTATATSLAGTSMIMQRLDYQMLDAELGNKALYVLKTGEMAMRKANLSVFYDDWIRGSADIVQKFSFKESLFNYSKLSKAQKADLAILGIDEKNVGRIVNQLKKHGKSVEVPTMFGKGKIYDSNERLWEDVVARDLWVDLIRQDSKRAFLSAESGDTPFIFSTPVGGLFLKYKSWGATATSKYLVQGLQNPKMFAPGIAGLVFFAGMSDILQQKAKGQEVNTDPDELLWAAINRSGVLGVFPETGGSYLLNQLADIESGGGKYYNYRSLPEVAGGAVFGSLVPDIADTGINAVKAAADVAQGEDVVLKKGAIGSFLNLMPIPFRGLIKPHIMEQIDKD